MYSLNAGLNRLLVGSASVVLCFQKALPKDVTRTGLLLTLHNGVVTLSWGPTLTRVSSQCLSVSQSSLSLTHAPHTVSQRNDKLAPLPTEAWTFSQFLFLPLTIRNIPAFPAKPGGDLRDTNKLRLSGSQLAEGLPRVAPSHVRFGEQENGRASFS